MGLDAVEIVLRTEELFVIAINDEEAAAVRTVGDFYSLICTKLHVISLSSPVTSARLPEITREEQGFLSSPDKRHCPHLQRFYRGLRKVSGIAPLLSLSIN